MHTTNHCLNCSSRLPDKINFCPHCGQNTHVHRFNLAHLVHEAVHFFTHADKGIFYLVRQLAVRPGIVAREYIKGKRKKYFSPLNFFFIAVGLFLFAQTTFRPMEAVDMSSFKEEVRKIPDQNVRERRLAKLNRAERAMTFMSRYSNYVNMAVTPLIALLFYLFFIRAGYNYTEHLVTNLYISGFNALVYVFFMTPLLIGAKGTGFHRTGIFIFLLFEVLFRTFTYCQFLQRKGFWSLLRVFLVALLAGVAWAIFSQAMVRWYIETGFQ